MVRGKRLEKEKCTCVLVLTGSGFQEPPHQSLLLVLLDLDEVVLPDLPPFQ